MRSTDLLLDAFDRLREVVHGAAGDLGPDDLSARVAGGANTVAWLLWHLTRVQDDHVADAAGTEQVWTAGGWARRFDLPFDDAATGYGQDESQVAAVRVGAAELLTGYQDDVHDATAAYVATLGDADLDRVVDEAWDPPVTLGVRLVSVVSDGLQHAGQAAFVRGVLERRRSGP